MSFKLIAAIAFAAAPVAFAADFDEAVDGDASGDRFNPTPLTLDIGTNTVRVEVVNSNDFVNGDIDYITLSIGAGLQLDSIILTESSAAGDNRAFIGLAAGAVMPVDPMAPNPGLLDGFVITESGLVGANILPDLRGFVPGPIGSSFQTLWIQQTGFDVTTIVLTLNVSQIPAPGTAALFGLAGLAGLRRRR